MAHSSSVIGMISIKGLYRVWAGFGETSEGWYTDFTGSRGPLAVLGLKGLETEGCSEPRGGNFAERVI